jgi:hypothetical protein
MKIFKRVLFSLGILTSTIFSAEVIHNATVPPTIKTGDALVPNDEAYYKYKLKNKDVEMIYTKDNIPFAKHTADIQEGLHNDYEEFYNWKLDETLYVGLISNCNQVANGFSTQSPNNRQINYIGGTSLVDYFANTSWLNGLIYHETAHNYQVNTKGSKVSQTLHTLFGNGNILVLVPVIVPNSVENSFMIEGNAVLNESWHGGGGRLYSGRFKAMVALQAKAGNINAAHVYNNKLDFPYAGNIYYQIGGFYNLFLAEKYGLKKVNSYFKTNSMDWYWPFRTNASMYKSIGVNFENSLNEYAQKYARIADKLKMAKGDIIASSQIYYQISSDADEIFFITNETAYRAPELVVLNKADSSVTKDRDSWLSGRVIKVDGEYYTQGSHHTSVTKIRQGLFDSEGFIKDSTSSKMVQGYLSDGRAVYFDVPSSYDQPQLYIGDEFYATVNSSVVIDKDDNIYYFANKNRGKERTLYKNKKPLFTYQGFYGIVSDVDSSGTVYFIANSEFGSTLYRYKDGKVTRASEADNILEARLINDNEVFLSGVSEKDYYYVKSKLQNIQQGVYETKLFFEDKDYYGLYKNSDELSKEHQDLDDSNSYYSMLNMHYSGTNILFGTSTSGEDTGSLNINFGDPLSQNTANLFVTRDDTNVTIAGAGYENSKYILSYSLSAYDVVDDDKQDDIRDDGIIASASLPFYQAGYYNTSLGATYFQDYDTLDREPLSAKLFLGYFEHYGKSMYSNFSNALSLYGVKEREDNIYGGFYELRHDIPGEIYVTTALQYSVTNADITDALASADNRGVKITNSAYTKEIDSSAIYMPSIDSARYVKSAGYGEVGISKVINISSYWFTFPFSLQRESIYTKYRYYNVEQFNTNLENETVNEVLLGARFDIILLNSLGPINFSLDYYKNDNDSFSKDNSVVKFTMGSTF